MQNKITMKVINEISDPPKRFYVDKSNRVTVAEIIETLKTLDVGKSFIIKGATELQAHNIVFGANYRYEIYAKLGHKWLGDDKGTQFWIKGR